MRKQLGQAVKSKILYHDILRWISNLIICLSLEKLVLIALEENVT